MNTNTIKSFARQARTILLDGVTQRLSYWGFRADGSNDQTLETTTGGYIFRGQVFTDTSVPAAWHKLKKRLTSKQAVQDVVEEAAYVWFNRLMAIKILEENGYLSPQLQYTPGMRTPLLVQNAKKGQHGVTRRPYADLLTEYLREDKEEEAFGLLLTRLCHNHALLQDVFGRIDDYTEILLPQNLLQSGGLLDLINSEAIPAGDYREVELIGWLYQFYISDRKDDVFAGFKKGKKARAEDIPAATQIFTPKWIVKYMVENTVGKLYLDYEPYSELKAEMKYLVENEGDANSPSLITDLTELTLLDPAAGSGHILVTGFELLFSMYREAGYTARNAVESILKHNLFGLDIDDRARQLARFAVLLKAASYDATILDKGLLPHIYSFPEPATFMTADVQAFLGPEGTPYQGELTEALTLLQQGKNIGSALKVELSPEARRLVEKQYHHWQQKHRTASLSIQETSLWNTLCPYLEVLLVLSRKYAAVVANPPYMTSDNFNVNLSEYLQQNYPNSCNDLMTTFIDAASNCILESGLKGFITLHSWLYIDDFQLFRQNLLVKEHISSLILLGRGMFGSDFGSCSIIIKNEIIASLKGSYIKLYDFGKISLINSHSVLERRFLEKKRRTYSLQSSFLDLEKATISPGLSSETIELLNSHTISNLAKFRRGIGTSENKRFIRDWFEVSLRMTNIQNYKNSYKWFRYNKGGEFRKWYGNQNHLVNWEKDGYEIKNFKNSAGKLKSRPQNIEFNFIPNISYTSLTISSTSARYYQEGFINDQAGNFLVLDDLAKMIYLLGFINSYVARFIIECRNPTVNILVDDLNSLPLKFEKESTIVDLINKCIICSKTDWDSRETSWDFQQSPLLNGTPALKQAYQRWEDSVTQDFFQLHANEEELNRIFIDIYGLQEELTPEVPLKDITILQEELDRSALEQAEPRLREQGIGIRAKDEGLPLVPAGYHLPISKEEVMGQFVSYAIGVLLGRYRLDTPGLHIAHPNPTEEELAGYTYNGHPIPVDEDAILPLLGEDGAFPDDALLRTKALILAIWGEDTLTENLNFLHKGLGMNLHRWLTEKFWGYHTSMYKKKPIYWLFCSNPKKPHQAAFRVLVYMHRMDKYTVGKIQRQYLHPHQEHIRHEVQRLAAQENSLGKAELKRLETLRSHELECRDYNEVLKTLALREIEFDLDDGVDVNYAKFEGAVARI